MRSDKKILIIGGAGFIGSHVNKQLAIKGYKTIVLDNLSRGHKQSVILGDFIKGDMADEELLSSIFHKYNCHAVMHFAALTNVGESVSDPNKYYKNNVSATLTILEVMRKHKVPNFIFSSSAAIFGKPQMQKITEEHPCHPINPYGQTKLMVEKILSDYEKAYGLRYSCLRYFNAAGGDPDNLIKYIPRQENNLIPLILSERPLNVYGNDYPTPDGTCIRDYIHIHDLGTAHITAMEHLLEGYPSSHYNLGNGNGFSVLEVIAAAEKVTGKRTAFTIDKRRPGDPPFLVADATKAQKELGWSPQHPALEDMIEHAWQARKQTP